jgi:hypothetical protein
MCSSGVALPLCPQKRTSGAYSPPYALQRGALSCKNGVSRTNIAFQGYAGSQHISELMSHTDDTRSERF